MNDDPRRALPSIDLLVQSELAETYGAARVALAAREVVAEARTRAVADGAPSLDALRARVRAQLRIRVEGVINATGVVLHTNLGRAPWSARAVEAARSASGYALLELDAETGARGGRGAGLDSRLRALTGAEASLVLNNGAAAVMLALAALARGQEVLVSRGQLVEIGGGFRIPEILEASGATLREVGTTNRTHLADYEAAMSDAVGAVLWVHTSNFRQIGFTAHPSPRELAELGPPLVVDLGSGSISGLGDEPSLRDVLGAGAGLVTCSGDKLLGGPQAGLVLGEHNLVQRLRRHPLARALRIDKTIAAALEATLDDWLCGDALPLKAMIETPVDVLRRAAQAWLAQLPEGVDADVVPVDGVIGGGSLPGRRWPSFALAIRSPDPRSLQSALLQGDPRVIARIKDGRLLLDARTVAPLGQGDALLRAVTTAALI